MSVFRQIAAVRKQVENGSISKTQAKALLSGLRLPPWLAKPSAVAPSLVVLTIWGGSIAVTASAFTALCNAGYHSAAAAVVALLLFAAAFIGIAGAFGGTTKGGIIAGQFPRRHDHPVYALRRIYGTAWTQLYYFRPLYAAVLAIPPLRNLAFALFGYRGCRQFVVYPDSWIRDLPLLDIGEGVYIGNRCVIGTNICLNDGTIVTGRVRLGDGAMIGHLAIIGTYNEIGEHATIGVRTSLGFSVTVGRRTEIGPETVVSHQAWIGEDVRIGMRCHVGARTRIESFVHVPSGTTIPDGMHLKCQGDVGNLLARSPVPPQAVSTPG